MASYDINKLVKLGALKQLAERIKNDYVTKVTFNSLNNGVTTLKTNVGNLQTKVKTLEQTDGTLNNSIKEISGKLNKVQDTSTGTTYTLSMENGLLYLDDGKV